LMETLGRYLVGAWIVFLLLAGILIDASFGGLLGDARMRMSVLLVLLTWIALAVLIIVFAIRRAAAMARGEGSSSDGLRWATRLFLVIVILAPLTGLGLAFLAFVGCGPLYLPNLYHWTGMVATVLGLVALFTLPLIVRACVGETDEYAEPYRWYTVVITVSVIVVVWGLVWLVAYLKLKGDIDESKYASAKVVYKLPWSGGDDSWVIQGNNSSLNHNDANSNQQFAWDFRRRCGTPVLAARDGTVSKVDDTHDGIGDTNNVVQVDHGDGTTGIYFHIQKGSAQVKNAAKVRQGDQLARAGCVGNSLTGHIHFMVNQGGKSIAIKFADVKEDSGIPRAFNSYTSGNR